MSELNKARAVNHDAACQVASGAACQVASGAASGVATRVARRVECPGC